MVSLVELINLYVGCYEQSKSEDLLWWYTKTHKLM